MSDMTVNGVDPRTTKINPGMGTEWGRLITAEPGTREYYEQISVAAKVIGKQSQERLRVARTRGIVLPVFVPLPSPDPWFWSRVDRSGDCWIWMGRKGGGEYGVLEIRCKKIFAHRKAWELLHGPIPPGMVICHRCDNPPCVRPDHLFLSTQADNIRDSVQKGRHGSLKQLGRKRGPYKRKGQQAA